MKQKILSLLVLLLTAATGAWADEPTSGTCGENVTWAVTGSENNYTLTIGGTGAMNDYAYNTFTNRPWNSYGTQIKNLVIENGVTHIGDLAFQWMEGLTTSVVIPGSVESVGTFSFYGTNLTSVTFSPGVKSIGKQAFYYISSLTSVTFGEGLEKIDESAFEGCTGLQTVEFPASIDYIDNHAFRSTSNVESYTFNGGVPAYVNTEAFDNHKVGCIVRVPKGTTGWDSNGDGIWDRKGTSYGLTIVTFASFIPYYDETVKGWIIEAMPAYDLVLTPRYAAATIYQKSGETLTEKQAYETLKEAIQNVQNGETIKLDWDVTFTAQDEPATTKTTQGGVKFTVDFNGHTIDGLAHGTEGCIILNNEGDEITFIDSSTNQADQAGGLKGVVSRGNVDDVKVIFDGGCYNFGDNSLTAAMLNDLYSGSNTICNLADGKEFVDIENAADDGFRYYVGYKSFELTIGPKKFATFYADQNVTLTEGTGIGFYTISEVNDIRTTATVTAINSTVIPAVTPTLVYNSGDDPVTAKLKVTTTDVNLALTVLHVDEFKGTAKAKEFTADDMLAADYYALSGGQFFVPVLDAGTIGKNRCWLQFDHQPQQPGARTIRLVFTDDDATGIDAVSGSPADEGPVYDLSGRRVAKPARKGVYIQSGKKVVR